MDQKLAELFQQKAKRASSAEPVDWDDRRDRYVAAVNSLYDQIKEMLSEVIDDQKADLQKRQKQLTESYIGTYAVDDLVLLIGDEQVRFSPRGRNIAGAEGRVDVVGERAEAALILGADGWAFVQSRQPKLTVVPLNQGTLAEVLRVVMRD